MDCYVDKTCYVNEADAPLECQLEECDGFEQSCTPPISQTTYSTISQTTDYGALAFTVGLVAVTAAGLALFASPSGRDRSPPATDLFDQARILEKKGKTSEAFVKYVEAFYKARSQNYFYVELQSLNGAARLSRERAHELRDMAISLYLQGDDAAARRLFDAASRHYALAAKIGEQSEQYKGDVAKMALVAESDLVDSKDLPASKAMADLAVAPNLDEAIVGYRRVVEGKDIIEKIDILSVQAQRETKMAQNILEMAKKRGSEILYREALARAQRAVELYQMVLKMEKEELGKVSLKGNRYAQELARVFLVKGEIWLRIGYTGSAKGPLLEAASLFEEAGGEETREELAKTYALAGDAKKALEIGKTEGVQAAILDRKIYLTEAGFRDMEGCQGLSTATRYQLAKVFVEEWERLPKGIQEQLENGYWRAVARLGNIATKKTGNSIPLMFMKEQMDSSTAAKGILATQEAERAATDREAREKEAGSFEWKEPGKVEGGAK